MARTQRIGLVSDAQADETQRKLLDSLRQPDGEVLNIFRTLANHADLTRRWLVFGSHVLSKSTLSPRVRELVILRTGWRCGSDYEWGQHVLIARDLGITAEEISGLESPDGAGGFTESEACAIQAADDLYENHEISDSTWDQLCAHYDEKQRMDLVFAVGQYTLVSMALNTFGVPRDAGVDGFDD